MSTPRHFVSQTRFGPTLASDRLPVVGGDRHRHQERARILRGVILSLGLFWAIVIGVIIGKAF